MTDMSDNDATLPALLIETIDRMAITAEHALDIVPMHIQRMHGYAYILAKSLEMTDTAAELLANACKLHDVGMVSVPVPIVRKTTNLSNDEWELVKQHPEVGAKMLSGSSYELFQIAERISLTHHERWDGSGYPQGLRGDAIPLEGRICGLCDVFDTLTHPRAYKRALSADEVLLLLQESKETFFDPLLIDHFTLSYPSILEVREKFKTRYLETL